MAWADREQAELSEYISGGLIILLLIGFSGFGWFKISCGGKAQRRVEAQRKWPSVKGEVLGFAYNVHDSKDGETYVYPQMKVKFQVGGKTYRAAKIHHAGCVNCRKRDRNVGYGSFKIAEGEVKKRFPKGSEVTLRYPPGDPARAEARIKPLKGHRSALIWGWVIVAGCYGAILGMLIWFVLARRIGPPPDDD